jgi:4-hydroxybenzoate polyprenyltransferase
VTAISPTPKEGQTFEGTSQLIRYINLVKLPHTVFALPFALVGVVLASYVAPVTWWQVVWVVVAFTAARFAAMGFNRIADHEIDARNPRTQQREIPSGALSVLQAGVAVVIAAGIFVFAASRLNHLCLLLSPLALGWVLFYSYTKRFTRWSHVVLGLSSAIAPVGGYLAVRGAWSAPAMLAALTIGVMTWVAGFDMLYALQDVEFDRVNRLHSIPATLGEKSALNLARVFHIITVMALGTVGLVADAGWIYFAGLAVATALLLYEHSLVKLGDLSKLDAAFFTMNGVISLVFFAFVLTERLVR